MYTCTFRRLMGECSICIHTHSKGWWINAQYVYMYIQRVDGWMLIRYIDTFIGLKDECPICIHVHSEIWWVNAQYVYIHIKKFDGWMLNMYTCTFKGLMGECSIFIPANSDGWLVDSQYVYMHMVNSIYVHANPNGGRWMLNICMYRGKLNMFTCTFRGLMD